MYKGERFNSISHLLGALLALVGLVLLVVKAAYTGDPWTVVSFSIYGATLLVLYLSSTLYHSLRGRKKEFFHKLDHLAIYLLIAGTYTPLTLVTLRSGWGWSVFGAVWFLALIGIVSDLYPRKASRTLPLIIYIIMGWFIVIVIRPLSQLLSQNGLVLLMVGGLFYTAGIFFYIFDKKVRYFHGVWHLFVLAGSLNHYFMMFFYVE